MSALAQKVLRWRNVAWLVLPYAAGLIWVQHLVRDPFNVDHLKRYVSLRRSARLFDAVGRPTPSDKLAELERALRRCQDIEVVVDGVWGGLAGKPSVRLKVLPFGETDPYFKYYAVAVSPMLGVVTIDYELSPRLYYLNL